MHRRSSIGNLSHQGAFRERVGKLTPSEAIVNALPNSSSVVACLAVHVIDEHHALPAEPALPRNASSAASTSDSISTDDLKWKGEFPKPVQHIPRRPRLRALLSASGNSAAGSGSVAVSGRGNALSSGSPPVFRDFVALAKYIGLAANGDAITDLLVLTRSAADNAVTSSTISGSASVVPVYTVYRALDNGASHAALLVNEWPLVEVRSIDGLGDRAREGKSFVVTFSGTPPLSVRAKSPRERAIFLWTVSQVFARELRRAPPTTGIRLLDLQEFVENDDGKESLGSESWDGTAEKRSRLDHSTSQGRSVLSVTNGSRSYSIDDSCSRVGSKWRTTRMGRGGATSAGPEEFLSETDEYVSEVAADAESSLQFVNGNSQASSQPVDRARRSRGLRATQGPSSFGRSRASSLTNSGDVAEHVAYHGLGDVSGKDSASAQRGRLWSRGRDRKKGENRSRSGGRTRFVEGTRGETDKQNFQGNVNAVQRGRVVRTVSEPNRIAALRVGSVGQGRGEEGRFRNLRKQRRRFKKRRGRDDESSVTHEEHTDAYTLDSSRYGNEDEFEDGPVAMRQQPATAGAFGQNPGRRKKVASDSMNIDERAFIVAVSRLGGVPVDYDGKTSATDLLRQRKMEEERRSYRLSDNDLADLDDAFKDYVLSRESIDSEPEDEKKALQTGDTIGDIQFPKGAGADMASSRDTSGPNLLGFRTWLNCRIASLERENIGDTLGVEKDVSSVLEPLSRINESMGSVKEVLKKCETRLSPEAAIIFDLHERIRAIETRRCSVLGLLQIVTNIIESSHLREDEQKLYDEALRSLRIARKAPGKADFCVSLIESEQFTSGVLPVVIGVALKSNYKPPDPLLLNLLSIRECADSLSSRRDELSSALQSVIVSCVEKVAVSGSSYVGRTKSQTSKLRQEAFMLSLSQAIYTACLLKPLCSHTIAMAYENAGCRAVSLTRSAALLADIKSTGGNLGSVYEMLCSVLDALKAHVDEESNVIACIFQGVVKTTDSYIQQIVNQILLPQVAGVLNRLDSALMSFTASDHTVVKWVTYLTLQAVVADIAKEVPGLDVQCKNKEPSNERLDGEDLLTPNLSKSKSVFREGVVVEHGNNTVPSASGTIGVKPTSTTFPMAVPYLEDMTRFQYVRDGAYGARFLATALNDHSKVYPGSVEASLNTVAKLSSVAPGSEALIGHRAEVFDGIAAVVSLCCDLACAYKLYSVGLSRRSKAQPSVNDLDGNSIQPGLQETKNICSKLIVAAHRVVETCSMSSPTKKADILKLECYTHMANVFERRENSMLRNLCHDAVDLVSRACRQTTGIWTERVVRSHLGTLLDAAHVAQPGAAHLVLEAVELCGDSARLVNVMRREMHAVLSPGALASDTADAVWACTCNAITSHLRSAIKRLEERDLTDEAAMLVLYTEEVEESCRG